MIGSSLACAPAVKRDAAPQLVNWELGSADPVPVRRIARVRIPYDAKLPDAVTQPLMDQFALVVISRPSEWASVRQQLDLDASPEELDFEAGLVVGIIGAVGEPATVAWPIRIEKARVREGVGQLEIEFVAGIYYPLQSAAFLELAYIPQVRSIRNVRINQQMYRIQDPSQQH